MNILDAIRDRQSIRSFKKDPIEREIIEKILNFARFAPSGDYGKFRKNRLG